MLLKERSHKLGKQGVSEALFDEVIRHFPNPCEFLN